MLILTYPVMVVVGKTKLTALITIPVKEEKKNN